MPNENDAASQQRQENSSSSDSNLSTEAILAQRGKVYGDFTLHASITWTLKGAFRDTDKWSKLDTTKKEALDMIAHKIGRILNGDPNYRDSWDDIAGYAKLAADRCK